jgi:serine O-acetyltransferase
MSPVVPLRVADQPAEQPIDALVESLVDSYRQDARGHHINRRFLPSREEIFTCLQQLVELMYPGYFGRQDLTDENIRYHVGNLLVTVRETLVRQVGLCLCYREETEGCKERAKSGFSDVAVRIVQQFLARLPHVRRTLVADVQAAYDGDPAALNLDEVILAYPGLLAITVHRLAHELYVLGVPLLPRIMTEWAHARTGADIHPGAEIEPSFFIDHATGVVVGETTRIGRNVKLYQGVTLGAVSHPKDERGRLIRGTKRHPTVEDNVTVYANATVLGGQTVIGEGALIGGSVFLTQTVPDHARVAMKPPELTVRVNGVNGTNGSHGTNGTSTASSTSAIGTAELAPEATASESELMLAPR